MAGTTSRSVWRVISHMADQPKRTEPDYVRAERVGGLCGARAVTGYASGVHVGHVVAAGGGGKVGYLVA